MTTPCPGLHGGPAAAGSDLGNIVISGDDLVAPGSVEAGGRFFANLDADANKNFIQIRRGDTVDADHIEYYLSARSDNRALWLIGYDGASYQTFLKTDWTGARLVAPQGLAVEGALSGPTVEALWDALTIVAFNQETAPITDLGPGWVDGFEDESGIDGPASTNESYDAAGDYYSPTIAAGATIDQYASTTIDAGYAIRDTFRTGVGQALSLAGPETIESLTVWGQATGSPSGALVAKIYAASDLVGVDAVPTGAPLATSVELEISGVGDGAYEELTFSFATPLAASAGDYVVVVEGATGYAAGTDVSNYLYIGVDSSTPGHAGNLVDEQSSTWEATAGVDMAFRLTAVGDPAALALVTAAQEADANDPSDADVIVRVKGSEPFVAGTDLLADISNDDGAHWDALTTVATLVDGATYKVIKFSGPVTPRADGTMRARVRTANARGIEIHNLGVRWIEA